MQKYKVKHKKINIVDIVNSTKAKTIIIGYMCKMMLTITKNKQISRLKRCELIKLNTKINKMFNHLASKLKKQITQNF